MKLGSHCLGQAMTLGWEYRRDHYHGQAMALILSMRFNRGSARAECLITKQFPRLPITGVKATSTRPIVLGVSWACADTALCTHVDLLLLYLHVLGILRVSNQSRKATQR